MIEIPQIIQAQRLFGEPDYLLHVVARDLPAFQRLYDEKLSAIPSATAHLNHCDERCGT